MSKKVLVPLAQGCEELEAVTIIDLFRRAGVDVVTASLDNAPVRCSRGVTLLADSTLDDILQQEFDMVVLPGGLPGADNLNKDVRIHQILEKTHEQGKYVAAICAAPRVLMQNDTLKGKKFTSFPGAVTLDAASTSTFVNAPVVVDGNVITSRGPGTAMDFTLQLIESLLGKEARRKVEEPLQRP